MENVLHSAIMLFRPEAVAEQPVDCGLIGDIREVCARLRTLEATYELTGDSDLLECNIYEQLALKAKYRYLLNRAKKQGLACPAELFGTD